MRASLLLLALAFAYIQSYALRTISAVLAPTLSAEMALSNAELGMLSSAYFIAFCFMQIPLGPLLDRFGTRKVEGILILIAALGSLIFATANAFLGLLIGRLLIGMGVSACLMGAFKSFREQFALAHQGTLSIFMLFFGSLGALMSTLPVHFLVEHFGWRPIFWGSSLALLLAALFIGLFVPAPQRADPLQPANPLLAKPSYRQVLAEPLFWQSVPIYFVMVGGYLALQSLWCGPWLIETAKWSAKQAAQGLLIMAVAQIIAYLVIGAILSPWASRHRQEGALVRYSFFLAVVSLSLSLIFPQQFGIYGLVGFAVFFASNTLSQTLVNAAFPSHMVGRSSTASNFLIFAGAFFFQWGCGVVVDFVVAFGYSRGFALNGAFALMGILMSGAWLWFVFSNRTGGLAPRIANFFTPKKVIQNIPQNR